MLLRRLGLVRSFSMREVAALLTVRGSPESLLALAALRLGLLAAEEFSALVVASPMTYPVATALLAPSKSSGRREVPR